MFSDLPFSLAISTLLGSMLIVMVHLYRFRQSRVSYGLLISALVFIYLGLLALAFFVSLGWFSATMIGLTSVALGILGIRTANLISGLSTFKSNLNDRQQLIQQIVENAYEGIYRVDPQAMKYTFVNPAGAKALGYAAEEMLDLPIEAVHPDSMPLMRQQFDKTLASGKRQRFTVYATHKDGHRIFVEVTLNRMIHNGQQQILAVGRDLSRWARNTQRVEKLNQLYALLSHSNRSISRIRDVNALLQTISDIAVNEGDFVFSWVGEITSSSVTPLCFSGEEGAEFLRNLKLDITTEEARQLPACKAHSSRKVVVVNDIATHPALEFQRDQLLAAGLASVAVLPLRGSLEEAYLLFMYSGQANAFDADLYGLLTQLSEDVSHALVNISVQARRKQDERQLKLLSSAIDQSADAVSILSTEGVYEYVNPRFCEVTGYAVGEVVGRTPRILCAGHSEVKKFEHMLKDLAEGRQWRGEFRNCRKNGDEYWSMDTISPIRDERGVITKYVATSEDYTALRRAQEKIQELAFYDPLTQLPNRRLLHDRLNQAIEAAGESYHYVALMLLDLDKFKAINDALGHRAGDTLLREIAHRLQKAIGIGDTVARLGGDEFVVVLHDVENVKDVVYCAERIVEAIPKPVRIEETPVAVTTSIGISLFPMDCGDGSELLRFADIAMYHAKSMGRNNFQFFTDEMNQSATEQMELERKLKVAIHEENFLLHYQPQVDAQTSDIVGAEALLRWQDETGEYIPPDLFIPVAEETGLMDRLGEWVLRQAITDLAPLQKKFGDSFRMAINISAVQFRLSDRLVSLVKECAEKAGVRASAIELELTETMLVNDVDDVIKSMNEIRKLGVSLAIDDFGTGYSSLKYLKDFPVNKLKVDQSFIRHAGEGESAEKLAAATIALGNMLNLSVLAEGVETETQLAFIRDQGCNAYQGFYFSEPLPLQEFLALAPGVLSDRRVES